MTQLLFIVFLVVPLVEIWLLIEVGSVIGAIWTVILVVLTAIIGAALVRAQGLATLSRAQAQLRAGELPAVEMFEGVALIVAGALLLTPGFFTDAVGFTLLVPPLRRWLIRTVVERRFIQPTPGPGTTAPGDRRRTLDGEFDRMDD
jgi:UPF0716 protein FxsA